MSYIVEQEIKGNIYLYDVESKWDKLKKKTYQKRTYLGPKIPKKQQKQSKAKLRLVNKNFGNIFFLETLTKRIGIETILKDCFSDNCDEIIALALYEVMEGSPFYLYHYWADENYFPKTNILDSSAVSNLFSSIGRDEKRRFEFMEKWTQHLNPVKALFFDISSISSYSTNISFIEWGYNRDKENLPQLNIGMVFCEDKKLPVNYCLYPGSIVDVSTLKNCKKYLTNFGLNDFLFILDRGFFSTANIIEMNDKDCNIDFIQPLPFSLKKAKDLVKEHKRKLKKLDTAFLYNNEILNYIKSSVNFENDNFDAHLFYNEKAEMDVRHNLLSILFEIEKKQKDKTFNNLKQWLDYKDNNITEKYRDFFKWNKTTKKAERNIRNINSSLSRSGYYIMATNKTGMSYDDVLTHYRNKDLVEKVFDVLKNEMDGKRLRTHNDHTTTGKLFIVFISLVIYSEIIRVMNQKDLFKSYTIKELLYELRKIKINHIAKDGRRMVSEISKKQKNIFKNFEIDFNELYGY